MNETNLDNSKSLKKLRWGFLIKESRKETFMVVFFIGLSFSILQLITIIFLNKTQFSSDLIWLSSEADKFQLINTFQFWVETVIISTCWLFSFLNIFSFKEKGNKTKRYWIFLNLLFATWIGNYLLQRYTLNTLFWLSVQSVLTFFAYISVIVFLFVQMRKEMKIRKQYRPKKRKAYIVLVAISLALTAILLISMMTGWYTSYHFYFEYEHLSEHLGLGDAQFIEFTEDYFSDGIWVNLCYIFIFFLSYFLFIYSSKSRKNAHKSVFYIAIANLVLFKHSSFILFSIISERSLPVNTFTYLYPISTMNLILFVVGYFLYRNYQRQQRIIDEESESAISKDEEMKAKYIESIIQIKAVYDKISLRRLAQLMEFSLDIELEDWLIRNAIKHIQAIVDGKVIFEIEVDNKDQIN